jgi:hypothetical protein
LGGSGSDGAESVVQTSDGGYIAAGYSGSNNGDVTGNHGGYDYWIVKLNSAGTMQWQKSLGGTGSEAANAILQASDGGYLVAGYSASNNGNVTGNHGGNDYWIVKLNSDGILQWQKSLGGSGADVATGIWQTPEGDYIISGNSASTNGDVTGNHGSSDYWIVKISSTGSLLWEKSTGGSGGESARSIVQTTDGGYTIVGTSNSHNGDVTGNHGANDYWIVKLSGMLPLVFYTDADSDGYGDANDPGISSCSPIAGKVMDNTDCDDSNAGVHEPLLYFVDADHDGYGSTVPQYLCALPPPIGFSANNTDCDDANAAISPGTAEICNGIDDNCDGQIDEGRLVWQISHGGSAEDAAHSIVQTSDGGFITAGSTKSNTGDVSGNHGGTDVWVVKQDVSGAIQWQHCYGGTGTDLANSIVQTLDGGYIFAGRSTSNNGDITGNLGGEDIWVVKINPAGDIQWQRSLGGNSQDFGGSVIQTTDSGYVVAGTKMGNNSYFDGYTIKLDANGTIQWEQTYGGSGYDLLNSVIQTADGGYLMSGTGMGEDFLMIRTDEYGNILWSAGYGGTDDGEANAAVETEDGGYVIAGYTWSNDGDVTGHHGYPDYWVIKLDSLGALQWQKAIGGGYWDIAYSVVKTNEGGYMVAGGTTGGGNMSSSSDNSDFGIVKLDSLGNILWTKLFGSSLSDGAYSMIPTDSGYVVAGSSASNDRDVTGNHGGFDFWIMEFTDSTPVPYYADADGDGFGDANDPGVSSCSPIAGSVTNHPDCDDSNANIHAPVPYYVDADHDGYGSGTTQLVCALTPPLGFSTDSTDCNDNNPTIHPGATEIINSLDDNCDGIVDNACTGGELIWQ